MPYSAPLDGLRALAILAVLFYHVYPQALGGGFIGVDVFFVLSGFLITTILLADLRKGTFSLREFYLRRCQRILPNVLVTLAAVLVLWRCFLPPSQSMVVGRHALWTLGNLSNYYIIRKLGGYWSDSAGYAPLLHTWSLAVEEQFYLVFPGALLLISRTRRPRVVLWLLLVGLVSLGLCVAKTHSHPDQAFYLLPSRVWELLMGAAFAAYRLPLGDGQPSPSPLPLPYRETAGWLGLGLILGSTFWIRESSHFPGAIALVPTVGTLLVLVGIADGGTSLARLLSMRSLVWLGKGSYSIYLWHWPLIVFGKLQAEMHGRPTLWGTLPAGAACLVLAWIMYHAVEAPLRKRGEGRGRRFAIIAGGLAVVGLGSWAMAAHRAMPDPRHRFETPVFSGLHYTTGALPDPDPSLVVSRYQGVYFPPLPAGEAPSWRTGGLIHAYGGGQPEVVVIGSSHALMYSRMLDGLCRDLGISIAFLGVDGTPAFFTETVNNSFPTVREARHFNDARKAWLRQWQPKVVFVVDRWDRYAGRPGAFDQELRNFLKDVSPLAERITLVTQVPALKLCSALNPRDLTSWLMDRKEGLPTVFPDEGEASRRETLALAQAATHDFPRFQVLRAEEAFYNPDGSVRYVQGRTFFYADQDHLADSGAALVSDRFRQLLKPYGRP